MSLLSVISDLYTSLTVSEIHAEAPPVESDETQVQVYSNENDETVENKEEGEEPPVKQEEEDQDEEDDEPVDPFSQLQEGKLPETHLNNCPFY
jgi:ubiquinol-cytochrome c reductase subunit 6